jgi:FkbM family methyltransferase
VRCDPANEAWKFWDRWADGRWEPHTREAIEAHCHGGTFVDVGAWVGPTARWAAPHASRVVCFEPDPTAFSMLVDNVADLDNVECHQVAVADHDGTTTVTTKGDSMSRTGGDGVDVRCATFESLFTELGIDDADLVKIDIEGDECDVLAEAGPFLRDFGAPLLLTLHLWNWCPDGNLDGWDVTELSCDEFLAVPT